MLFSDPDLRSFLEQQKKAFAFEIGDLDRNYLLNVNEEKLIQTMYEKYSVKPLILHLDKKTLSTSETDVQVGRQVGVDRYRYRRIRGEPIYRKTLVITILIPFEGNNQLPSYQPSTFTFNPPRGEVRGNNIILKYMVPPDIREEELQAEIKRDCDAITELAGYAQKDIMKYNDSLIPFIKMEVQSRKSKLLKDLKLVESLNIPFHKHEHVPKTYSVPVEREKLRINLLSAPSAPYSPEPTLDSSNYEDILEIIHDMSLTMERNRNTFNKFNETMLRDQFLVSLNSHFQGKASGETFNSTGKTDILIRYENQNIFIAECKIWGGKATLLKAIDQLMGYLTYRDTKTALLIFSKRVGFTSVIDQIDSTVKSHSNYLSENKLESKALSINTIFSFKFTQAHDENRVFLLTVLLFDVSSSELN